MTFLPVAERELRVAARKRSTFWVRMIAALVAFAIGAGFLCVAERSIRDGASDSWPKTFLDAELDQPDCGAFIRSVSDR